MSKANSAVRQVTDFVARKQAQLSAFLGLLSPEIAQQLAVALERDRLKGGSSGLPVDAILESLRPRLRELPLEARQRIPTPERKFFEVTEGMIVETPGEKTAGRILRRSLDPIWRWLVASEGERIGGLADQLATAILSGDTSQLSDALRHFDIAIGETIRAAVKKVESKDRGGKDIVPAVGGQRAFEDMRELGRILQVSEEIRELKAVLPPVLNREDEEQFALIRGAFERAVEKSMSSAPYLVLSLAPRVAHQWELFGIAAKLVRAEHDQHLKASELAMVGEWLVQGLESEAVALRAIKPSELDPALAEDTLCRFARLQTGMTREVGMRKDGAWGKRLLKTRGLVSSAMEDLFKRIVKELQTVFPMQRASSGSRSGALVPVWAGMPDPLAGERMQALTRFLARAKQFAGQLGYSVALEATLVEIQTLFDDYTDGLLDNLAQAKGAERDLAQAWADLTVGVMTPIFSEEAMRILSRRMAAAQAEMQAVRS